MGLFLHIAPPDALHPVARGCMRLHLAKKVRVTFASTLIPSV